ncbi:MAG: hypothetical protein ACE5I7_17005 [Candidatus Binatia bacterium]
MERLRRRRQEEDVVLQAPPPRAPIPTVPEERPAAPAGVQVIWGPIVENMAAAGMTVGDIRALLQHPYNIPAYARPLVNGTLVRPGHRLTAGDTLEFSREGGEKGGHS